MKPHVVVRLAIAAPGDFPHWSGIIEDKTSVPGELTTGVGRVLRRFGLRAWPSHEYQRSGEDWTREERGSGLDRVYRLILHEGSDVPAGLIDALVELAEVEEARAGVVGASPLPSPEMAQALGRRSDWAREAIRLDGAHRLTRGHPAVTIAILDTGLDLRHPEYADVLLPGMDFVDVIPDTLGYLEEELDGRAPGGGGRGGSSSFVGDSRDFDDDPGDEWVGHGTHVAGILAARGRRMPEGVAPDCRILPVRVLGALRRGDEHVGAGLVDNINVAVKWAVDRGADVINMSLGIRHEGGGLPHEEVVDYAARKGVTVVAAAGNDGRDELYYPGALPHVLSIGACDRDGEVTPFSTYGKVDLVAPGTEIFSTFLNGGYAHSTGTSHAAPFVAGAAALLRSYARSRGHHLGDRESKHLLRHTADRADRSFRSRRAGFGRVNVADALRLLHHKLN